MNSKRVSKIAVIGAGPAGLFAAYELATKSNHSVYLFDRGPEIGKRVCPDWDCVQCPYRDNCAILCGEGGAGGYSDGKLTLSVGRGIQMSDELQFERFQKELDYVDSICVKFGPPSVYYKPIDCPGFVSTKFGFESYPLRFFGTNGIRQMISSMHGAMLGMNVKFNYNRSVKKIKVAKDYVWVDSVVGPESVLTEPFDRVIIATGSYDNTFMRKTAILNGIPLNEIGPAGLGIRLEAKDEFLEPLMSEFYDFKLYLNSRFLGKPIQYRSFCVNRGGKITNEVRPGGLVSINGRSEQPPTGRSNLAIMSRIEDGKELVREIAMNLNIAGKHRPVSQSVPFFFGGSKLKYTDSQRQHLKKLRHNATPANLAAHLPTELLQGFREYLTELDKMLPGLLEDANTVIYGPEIKYHMPRWQLQNGFEVSAAPKLQVIGNAAGYTDSISTAATMGIVAARHLIKGV